MGSGFVPAEYLPDGCDEYTLRDRQVGAEAPPWRPLRAAEIERLVRNGNTSDDWDRILVAEPFDPRRIVNNSFYGLVRIGVVEDAILEHHDLRLPVGIRNSTIVSCDIGDNVAVHNVAYLAHYIVGDRAILTNIDEMHTTNHAKFGNGVLKDGEEPDVRVTLDLINESGTRWIHPFDGMIAADAYLWARYRDDARLMTRLVELTDHEEDSRRGWYGTVGSQSVLKNARIIKDVRIGEHCYIKGANKLKNLTINSSADAPTQIGEGVELVNGIVGHGCRVFYGCKAVRFVMGENCSLKYGARLIHSFMGDNSTVSCCELLNNLIFPAHEQHHNNSFLVAALVMGQSNIAAGCTIGSNHNSRANDNEIQAGRGFWPGLSTSLKHSSRFASFVLMAKGDYPAELDIPLPFSLVSNNVAADRLEVRPAFWWTYNMYALARNEWKFRSRDRRVMAAQHVEFDVFAPDTCGEIAQARDRIVEWLVEAERRDDGAEGASHAGSVAERRTAILHSLHADDALSAAALIVDGFEKSNRDALVVNPVPGWRAYTEMLHYYAARTLVAWLGDAPGRTIEGLAADGGAADVDSERAVREPWVNLGGQLVPETDVDDLRRAIREGEIASWREVHARYDELWSRYPFVKARHAWAIYRLLDRERREAGTAALDWERFLTEAVAIQEGVRDRVRSSRERDFANPFRRATYRTDAEMVAALGTIDDNPFVRQVRDATETFRTAVAALLAP